MSLFPPSSQGGSSTPAVIPGEVRTFLKSKVPAGWTIISSNAIFARATNGNNTIITTYNGAGETDGRVFTTADGKVLLLPRSATSSNPGRVKVFNPTTGNFDNFGEEISANIITSTSISGFLFSYPVELNGFVYCFNHSTSCPGFRVNTTTGAVERLAAIPSSTDSTTISLYAAVRQSTGTLYMVRGAASNGGRAALAYNPATGAYTVLASTPSITGSDQENGGRTEQKSGKLFYFGPSNQLAVYDINTNTWGAVQTTAATNFDNRLYAEYEHTADDKLKIAVRHAANASTLITLDPATSSITVEAGTFSERIAINGARVPTATGKAVVYSTNTQVQIAYLEGSSSLVANDGFVQAIKD